jgi:hypothetical protein
MTTMTITIGRHTYERPAYEVTERERERAGQNADYSREKLARIDERRAALPATATRRMKTKLSLTKMRAACTALHGSVEWFRGRGQGIIDALVGLPYSDERFSNAYNLGYHDGYCPVRGNSRHGREVVERVASEYGLKLTR